jgi:hypothetical protein
LTAKKVSKEALSTASSPTAVGYLHYTSFSSKNSKLTTFKQLSFLNEKKKPPFSSADVSMRITGDALINVKAKAFIPSEVNTT